MSRYAIRTKDDVETHREGYGYNSLPAVNVKVYAGFDGILPICLGGSRPANEPDTPITWHYTDERFTVEWCEKHLGDQALWGWQELACESGWEFIRSEAEEIFDQAVQVYAEGRSGGWAVVRGLPDIESWDAVMLAKWRKFAKSCRAAADDIPRSTLELIYINVFEPVERRRRRVDGAMLEADEALDDVRDWRQGVRLVAEAEGLHS